MDRYPDRRCDVLGRDAPERRTLDLGRPRRLAVSQHQHQISVDVLVYIPKGLGHVSATATRELSALQ